MGIAEGGKQNANLFERELAARLAGALVELGNHGIELIDGGGVGHGQFSIEGGQHKCEGEQVTTEPMAALKRPLEKNRRFG